MKTRLNGSTSADLRPIINRPLVQAPAPAAQQPIQVTLTIRIVHHRHHQIHSQDRMQLPQLQRPTHRLPAVPSRHHHRQTTQTTTNQTSIKQTFIIIIRNCLYYFTLFSSSSSSLFIVFRFNLRLIY